MRQIGKKGRAWNSARQQAKELLQSHGIRYCEIQMQPDEYEALVRRLFGQGVIDSERAENLIQRFRRSGECRRSIDGMAHPRKRRNLGSGEISVCIGACNVCHDRIEALPEDEMARIVYRIIANRGQHDFGL